MHKKLIFLVSLIFINLNGAQYKVRTVADQQIAAEVKIRDEHLHAAQYFNTNDPVKIQQLKEVQELLLTKLPVQNGPNNKVLHNKPIYDIIFDYVQADFAFQSTWHITKLPISDVLPNKEFIVRNEYLISYDIKDNQLEFLQKFKAHEKKFMISFF